jgi:hypothetical protein
VEHLLLLSTHLERVSGPATPRVGVDRRSDPTRPICCGLRSPTHIRSPSGHSGALRGNSGNLVGIHWTRDHPNLRILDAQPLADARDRLAIMFAGRPEDAAVSFSISEDGGRIWFSDANILWQTRTPATLPANPQAAEIAARAFMGRINSAVQGDRALAAAGIDRLFPDDCRPALNGVTDPQAAGSSSTQSVLVTDPDRGVVDHWLVRFEAYLPTGASAGSIPVFGARVDFRVGPGGVVGACWVTWRPCIPQGMTPLLPFTPPASNGAASASTSSGQDGTPPQMVYFLADEGTAQPYLAPYYFMPQDDDGFYVPASAFSLIAELADDSTGDTARIAAVVNGGSGQYAYRWAAWDQTNLAEGMVDMGTEDRIELDPGCYNVVVRITDTTTGMAIYVERSIYTDMLGGPQGSS